MNKKIKFIVGSCLLAAITACTSEMPLQEKQVSPEKSVNISKRSIDDIIAIASAYGKTRTTASRSGQFNLTRKAVVPIIGNQTRGASDTLIYAVNYPNDNGYLIVSADKTTEPILAMIDNGSFDASRLNQNDGLEYFVNCANEYVKSSRVKYLDSIPDYRMEYYRDTIKSVSVSNPKLEVNWNQSWPENIYCPNKVAGCVPVAIAQVLSYFKPELTINLTFDGRPCNTLKINWDELLTHRQSTFFTNPTQREIDNHMANCSNNYGWHQNLAALIRQIGEWSKSSYKPYATSTQSNNAWSTCNNLLPQQSKTYISGTGFYNELTKGGIALISGVSGEEEGHAWVLDGTGSIEYEYWTYYSYNPITGQYGSCDHNKTVSQYVHCNWGWGGQDNGYFHEGVFDTSKGVENLTRTNYSSKIKGYVYK